MDTESLRQYCINKKGVCESLPFDDTTLVFKVANKMFALMNLAGDLSINLKCIPEDVINNIEKYDSVLPGYHMNKKHWITVVIDSKISDDIIKSWIDDSYNLILSNLSKNTKQAFDL